MTTTATASALRATRGRCAGELRAVQDITAITNSRERADFLADWSKRRPSFILSCPTHIPTLALRRLCQEAPTRFYRSMIGGDCVSCEMTDENNPFIEPLIVIGVLLVGALIYAALNRSHLQERYRANADQILTVHNHGTMMFVTYQIIASLSKAFEFGGGSGCEFCAAVMTC